MPEPATVFQQGGAAAEQLLPFSGLKRTSGQNLCMATGADLEQTVMKQPGVSGGIIWSQTASVS